MADPYEVDDEGTAVAETGGEDPVRRQIELTLRFMTLSTIVGLLVIAILAVVLADVRGVLILVFFVYLVTSLAARWYLKRNFEARLKGPRPGSD